MHVLHKNGSSLWITAMTEYQRFTTEIDITHLTNISTWIQLYTEVRKKSDVVFRKSLGLTRFEPGSSCILAVVRETNKFKSYRKMKFFKILIKFGIENKQTIRAFRENLNIWKWISSSVQWNAKIWMLEIRTITSSDFSKVGCMIVIPNLNWTKFVKTGC